MRIVVVADDLLARSGLANLLDQLSEMEVVAEAHSGDSLSSVFATHRPEAVVWDLGWGEETPDWEQRFSDLVEDGAVIVALLSDPSHTAEAWSSGARGVLHREAGPRKIAAALQAAIEDLTVAEQQFTRMPEPSLEIPDESLTERELQVLRLLAEGLSNRTIAYRLEISEHTIKFHVNGILRKLGAQSRTEAVVRATRMGLILL